eukprot:SAG31_NODE_1198_length_9441_cov_3.648897_1_plen_144_part_10
MLLHWPKDEFSAPIVLNVSTVQQQIGLQRLQIICSKLRQGQRERRQREVNCNQQSAKHHCFVCCSLPPAGAPLSAARLSGASEGEAHSGARRTARSARHGRGARSRARGAGALERACCEHSCSGRCAGPAWCRRGSGGAHGGHG